MGPAAVLIGNQYLRPLTAIKQMVKWSWTEVLRGLMNFSPGASGQESDPSDKKHISKIQPCRQFKSPESSVRYITCTCTQQSAFISAGFKAGALFHPGYTL